MNDSMSSPVQAKELTLFKNESKHAMLYFVLNENPENTSTNLVTFLSDTNKIVEENLKETIKQTESLNKNLQNVYVLYGDKSVLLLCKEDTCLEQIEHEFANLFEKRLERKPIPFTNGQVPVSLFLVSEISDAQLELVSSDKSDALKLIEAKTGLKLKKIKKTIYFTGLLFQFALLNQLITNRSLDEHFIGNEGIKDLHSSSSHAKLEWKTLYYQSDIKFNFKLKSKADQVEFDVFVFCADLTELNTDALVNATNVKLHPGYDGDGISRRIREKGGKQLQDSVKKILKKDTLKDSDVIATKAYGKLRSKYILHTVTPSWSSYISNSNICEQFESVLEQTLVNVLKTSDSFKFDSIAFPVSEKSTGGAFDVPLELWAYSIYNQLLHFDEPCSNLKTICITSLEPNTINCLVDIFGGYNDSYATSSWALPVSPFARLIEPYVVKTVEPPKIQTPSNHKTENQVEIRIESKSVKLNDVQANQNISSNPIHKEAENKNDFKVIQNLKENLENKPNLKNNLDIDRCCLFCQKENNLITCGNSKCTGAYCETCIFKYFSKQSSYKCPSCKGEIDKSMFSMIRDSSSSSCSSSPTRISFSNNTNNSNNINNMNNTQKVQHISGFSNTRRLVPQRNCISEARIFIKKIDEPCAGYEDFQTVVVTFEVSDGIQKVHF
jgi:O-acetyl-ADP-ribose deacetylase (regulator of RNase III)